MPSRVVSFLRNVFRPRAVERDLNAEVGSYLELLVEEKMTAGMAPEAARRAARLELGSGDDVKESVRDARAGAWLAQVVRDVRYGLRGLARTPVFTSVAMVTLALGIGGTTVIFTLVNAVLLRPLAYPEPDRLVMVMEANPKDLGDPNITSAPNYLDWERRNHIFQRMALYESRGFNLSGEREPEVVAGLRASSGLFEVLAVSPLLGRGFLPEDDLPEKNRIVVLSEGLWRHRYGADPEIVGKAVRINQEAYTVVGVMPRALAFPSRNEALWVPIGLNKNDRDRASHSFFAVARLKPGVSLTQAGADMRAIGDALAAEYPKDNEASTAVVFPIRDLWMTGARGLLRTLFGAVALVLLIACANVASLLAARGVVRRRELAVRIAIGGSRARIVSQLLIESVLLSGLGSLLGFGLAAAALPVLISMLPPQLSSLPFRELGTIAMDRWVFGFSVGVALLAGVVSGIAPALHVLPSGPSEVLKEGEARGSTARRGGRLRNGLVALEAGLAVVVLAAAGLLVVSIRKVLAIDPGLDPAGVVTMGMALPQANFYGPPARPQFCSRMAGEVGAVPGVTAVSAVSHLPLSGENASRSIVVEGLTSAARASERAPGYGVICPAYFRTMGIPLTGGRDFTAMDAVNAPAVVIVNETLKRRYFADVNPVGRRIRLGRLDEPSPWLTIVGVVANVRHSGLASEVDPYLYRPYSQAAWPSLHIVIKSERNDPGIVGPVRRALGRIEPEQPIEEAVPMPVVVERSLGFLRFPMTLFLAFALLSLVLAAAGIFGVASQSVAQRTRELGIRKAVGAKPADLYRLVIGQTMTPVAYGIGAGILGSLLAARMLRSLLFGIAPVSVATLVLVSLILAAVAALAVLVPAHRAAHLDPVVTLRDE
ncbi:MAG: ABC transporter permease [Gemmatimonadota bacterium]